MAGVTMSLLTAGFEDMARTSASAIRNLQDSINESLRKINEALATTPDARAYADFIKDGGDPRFIEAVEEHFGVTHS